MRLSTRRFQESPKKLQVLPAVHLYVHQNSPGAPLRSPSREPSTVPSNTPPRSLEKAVQIGTSRPGWSPLAPSQRYPDIPESKKTPSFPSSAKRIQTPGVSFLAQQVFHHLELHPAMRCRNSNELLQRWHRALVTPCALCVVASRGGCPAERLLSVLDKSLVTPRLLVILLADQKDKQSLCPAFDLIWAFWEW